MQPKPANLEQIQRWMQSVIMHPGGVAEGLDAPETQAHLAVAADELESVIAPSASLDSAQRLEIYVTAYHERLLECLREEFAATRAALGEELFEGLAFGYLQHYPSRSYTLNMLGARFAQFLAETRLHAHAVPEEAGDSWTDFVIELAELERALREVFDGEGIEEHGGFTAEGLKAVLPHQWGRLRLSAAPCLRLRRFAHPVHAYWGARKRGEQPPAPDPRETHLAIHRRQYSVDLNELQPEEFALLGRLTAGATLSEGLDALGPWPVAAGSLDEKLRGWFAAWTERGYFTEAGVAGE